ncbi:MAG: cytochrome c oxidase accessory protein CcoG [Ectothiorhodospira sp.]
MRAAGDRIPLHPRSVRGRFRRLKWGILLLAYGVYFLLPWLRWERPDGPDQAVLLDLPARQFHLLGLSVHPQDLTWLILVLLMAALLLFWVTGWVGRVLCGYFCFQTLWTDVFMAIERRVQGDRGALLRLEREGPAGRRLVLRAVTHGLWLLVALATGVTFTLYWGDAPTLAAALVGGTAPFAAYATAGLLTLTTYVLAGWLREQVCTYMCPYARFQSVMVDRDTLIVSYDPARGEGTAGRAPLARDLRTRTARRARGVGDCIDCGYCVQVCPVGVDIRRGLQYPCIHCALCVDACDRIMDRLGWPRGLVRYTSQNALEGRPVRRFRPRLLGYALALAAVTTLLVWDVAHQAPLEASVHQVRQPLFVRLVDGGVQNGYEIKLNNKTGRPLTLALRVSGLPGAVLDTGRIDTVTLAPGQRITLMARVRHPDPPAARHPLVFRIEALAPEGLPGLRVETQFIAP